MAKKSVILNFITDFYLTSGDFNGCSYFMIMEEFPIPETELLNKLKSLINDQFIGIISPSYEMNTHIIRTDFLPTEKQLEFLDDIDEHHSCFYPRTTHLKKVVKYTDYINEPYKYLMALGRPQLSYKSFDLSVLEIYRNDPRYRYDTNDIGGTLGVTDEYFESKKMQESDKVLLQSFGFSINESKERAVAVFLCDLAGLTKEHQKIWKVKEVDDSYKMHPGFYRSQVLGSWDEGASLFDSLLKEINLINKICQQLGWINLWKDDFGEYGDRKPKNLTFLIRPTLNEFNSFSSTLDKILSENINRDFFKGQISLEEEKERDDGKIIVTQKGTIQLLDNWMRKKFKFHDDSSWSFVIKILKKVRKLRQSPAHKLEEDTFDQKYFRNQRELSIEVYQAINFIRELFMKHPKVDLEAIDVPDWLTEGKIYTY